MGTPLHTVGLLHADLAVREAAELMSRSVERCPGISAGRLLEAAASVDEASGWRAKRLLVEHGYIENRQEIGGRSHRYFVVKPYRIDTDPDAEHRPTLTTCLEGLVPRLADVLVEHRIVTLVLDGGLVRVHIPGES